MYSRKDQFGVELRERAKWDLREAMVGTETFLPKHVVIATWKNVSFAGGIPQARGRVRKNIVEKLNIKLLQKNVGTNSKIEFNLFTDKYLSTCPYH